MANPQRENGHVDIANELVEAFAKYYPSHSEGQIIWAILRKTYGWHKKEDPISITQIMEMTGISRRMVIYSLQNLEAKRIIIIKRKKGRGIKNEVNTISLQKNYDLWVVQEKSKQYRKALETRKKSYRKSKDLVVQETVSSARNENLVVQEIEKEVKFLAPTKETNTKETITKTKGDVFIEVWKEFKVMRKKIKKPMTERAEELLIKKLNTLSDDEEEQIAILNQSIMNCWLGVFPLKEDPKNDKYDNEVKVIIDYLNEKANKNYSMNIPDKTYIITRLKEGRPIEDFKKIIDIKCDKWRGKYNKEGNPLEDYLTPKTLFGINFENYLNETEEDKYAKYIKKE